MGFEAEGVAGAQLSHFPKKRNFKLRIFIYSLLTAAEGWLISVKDFPTGVASRDNPRGVEPDCGDKADRRQESSRWRGARADRSNDGCQFPLLFRRRPTILTA